MLVAAIGVFLNFPCRDFIDGIEIIRFRSEFLTEKQMTLYNAYFLHLVFFIIFSVEILKTTSEWLGFDLNSDWEFLPEKQMTLYNAYFLHQLIVGVLQ